MVIVNIINHKKSDYIIFYYRCHILVLSLYYLLLLLWLCIFIIGIGYHYSLTTWICANKFILQHTEIFTALSQHIEFIQ